MPAPLSMEKNPFITRPCTPARHSAMKAPYAAFLRHNLFAQTAVFARPTTMPEQRFRVPERMPYLELRTTIGSSLPYAEHLHTAFSLGAILFGSTQFRLGERAFTAREGDLVLITPGQAHSCNPLAGASRSYHMVFLDPAWMAEHVGGPLFNGCAVGVKHPVIRDSELFERLLSLIRRICASHNDEGDALARLFVAMHTRHNCLAVSSPASSGHTALLDDAFAAAMDADNETPLVKDLARHARMRRESFSRSVKRKSGLCPRSRLHSLRLEKGKMLLRKGLSICDAALASGYADQSHFHRMFVKYCSATPGCYKKSLSHSFKK